MTVSSGFFNSINHDRLYDAEQVSSIFDGIIEDGVYESIGEAFMVTAYPDSNDTVIVGTGRAWFDHTWTLNDTQFSITLNPPNTLLGRIDSIVIDVDRRDSVRKNSIILVEGEYAEKPVAPTLINEELHKQYPIANIQVDAGVSAPISQSKITYLVGTDPCPIVTGPLEAFNISNYFQQMESEFEIWFEGVKDILDENVAMDLQNQINELKKNQTVSEEGEIGDFTILMTTAMIEALKTRGSNLHFSSKQIAQRAALDYKDVTFEYTDPPASQEHPYTGYRHYSHFSKSFPYNQSFFMPNGSIARVGVVPYYENFSSQDRYGELDGASFYLDIITQEGVVTNYLSNPLTYSIDISESDHSYVANLDPGYVMFNGMAIISYEYPIKIVCSAVCPSEVKHPHSSSKDNSRYAFGVFSCLITITQANVVTFSTYSDVTEFTAQNNRNGEDYLYRLANTHAFETPDHDLIFLNTGHTYAGGGYPDQYQEGVSKSIAYKIDTAGVMSNGGLTNTWSWFDIGYYLADEIDVTDYYYNSYYSSDGNIYVDFGTNLNYSSRNHFLKINPTDLSISSYTGNIPGTVYYPSIDESVEYYSNNIVKKRTWSNYLEYSDSNVTEFNPLILFTSNMSMISSATLCKLFDIKSTEILAAINTGSNCRGIFAGKNGIGFYGESVATSVSNSDKINLDRFARNDRRVIEDETSITLLFDDSTVHLPTQSDSLGCTETNNSASANTSNMYIFKIWYETED